MSERELGRIGERIDARYELVAPRPDAGLGEAWTAVDATRGRAACLVKLLPSSPSADVSWATLIKRLTTFSNTRIARFLDAGTTPDGRRWLALEPVPARSLRNWLDGHREAGTTPGLGVVSKLFDAIALAVQAGHSAAQSPLSHGGLSPASVMLDSHGGGIRVVLLDHGVAPFTSATEPRSYLPPEAIEGRIAPSPSGDVFALAVLLSELLTLRATPGEDERETWADLVKRAPKTVKGRLSGLRSDVPAALWGCIAEGLSPSPERRPQTAQALSSSVRDAQPAEWRRLPIVEREPPLPSGRRTEAAATKRESSAVPVGWQAAERRASVASSDPVAPPSVSLAPSQGAEGDTTMPSVKHEGPTRSEVHAATLEDGDAARILSAHHSFAAATLVDDDVPSAMRDALPNAAPARPSHNSFAPLAGDARRSSAPQEPTVPRVGVQTVDLTEGASEHEGWNAQPRVSHLTGEVVPPREMQEALARRVRHVGGDTAPIERGASGARVGGKTADLSDAFGSDAKAPIAPMSRPQALMPSPLASPPVVSAPPRASRPVRPPEAAITEELPSLRRAVTVPRWVFAGIATIVIAAIVVALLAR